LNGVFLPKLEIRIRIVFEVVVRLEINGDTMAVSIGVAYSTFNVQCLKFNCSMFLQACLTDKIAQLDQLL
jgi:hypothetical protein